MDERRVPSGLVTYFSIEAPHEGRRYFGVEFDGRRYVAAVTYMELYMRHDDWIKEYLHNGFRETFKEIAQDFDEVLERAASQERAGR